MTIQSNDQNNGSNGGTRMKAIVCPKYGPPEVLKIEEIEKPMPKHNEILVKVHATSVTLYDCWQRSGYAPPGFGFLYRLIAGFNKPKQPIHGTELSGEVEAVGKDVSQFKKGDRIMAYTGLSLGAYVQYICLPEDSVVIKKPDIMTYEEAAAVQQGGLTALYFLKKADIKSGQKILIFGASGGVGMLN
ncbi:MAG: NAD(P)-dependent alcohol dehydrogenase [Bacteroidetes bacterium]|nr:NAD(P)-dependent alcohol dehydrogenase [Bacteroidota bacterium]